MLQLLEPLTFPQLGTMSCTILRGINSYAQTYNASTGTVTITQPGFWKVDSMVVANTSLTTRTLYSQILYSFDGGTTYYVADGSASQMFLGPAGSIVSSCKYVFSCRCNCLCSNENRWYNG